MKTIKIPGGNNTFHADKANTTYIFASDQTLEVPGHAIMADSLAKGRLIEVDGSVYGDVAAIAIGYQGSVSPIVLNIGKDADISGGTSAILSFGGGHIIRNAGQISALDSGIEVYDAQTIVNTGEISGHVGISFFGSGGSVLRNAGTISTTNSDHAILGSDNGDKVINSGTINGNVTLGHGNDTFVFKGGVVNGIVSGGFDNDTYVVHKAGLNIVENAGEGNDDQVRSTITFTLPANVEELYLLGKRNIEGIGNSGDNWLSGNAGKNFLLGREGSDVLNGHEGNDILTGGAGADMFVFQAGTGRDIVNDFEPHIDAINLAGLKGVKGFDDMLAHHVSEKVGGDLWITYGHDSVVLRHTELSDLFSGDFYFSAK